jgi:hypothetical protein
MMKYVEASLETLDGGKAIRMVDYELGEAIKSCLDPNKDTKAKRKVTLTLTLQPSPDRQGVGITFGAKSTLPGDMPGVDHILVSQSGNAYVGDAEQLALDNIENIENVENINKETGEVL